MSALEEATTLTSTGEGRWIVHADQRYESINGMFGGWTAAVLLRAVIEAAAGVGTPSALTANFVGKVEPGSDVQVQVLRVGGGRALQHWRAELVTDEETPRTLAQALLVTSDRRSSDAHLQPSMPTAPDPDGIEDFHPPGPQGSRLSIRPVHGHPPFGRGDTVSVAWVRDVTGRPVDHVQLAFLADAYAPRSFYWSDGPRISATMSLSVYFLATPAELSAIGDDFLLNEATGSRAAESTSGQSARLWSRQGALLATTEQLCWYR